MVDSLNKLKGFVLEKWNKFKEARPPTAQEKMVDSLNKLKGFVLEKWNKFKEARPPTAQEKMVDSLNKLKGFVLEKWNKFKESRPPTAQKRAAESGGMILDPEDPGRVIIPAPSHVDEEPIESTDPALRNPIHHIPHGQPDPNRPLEAEQAPAVEEFDKKKEKKKAKPVEPPIVPHSLDQPLYRRLKDVLGTPFRGTLRKTDKGREEAKQSFKDLKRRRRGRLGKSQAERLETLSPEEKERRMRSLGEAPQSDAVEGARARGLDADLQKGPRSSLELDVDRDTILLDKLEKELEEPERNKEGKITKELTKTQKKNNARKRKIIKRIRKRRDRRAANLKALTGKKRRTFKELEEQGVDTIEDLEIEGGEGGYGGAKAEELRQDTRNDLRMEGAKRRDEEARRKRLEKEGLIEPDDPTPFTDEGKEIEFPKGLNKKDFKHHEDKVRQAIEDEEKRREDTKTTSDAFKGQKEKEGKATKDYHKRLAEARKEGAWFTPEQLQNEKFIEDIKGMDEDEWKKFKEEGFVYDLPEPQVPADQGRPFPPETDRGLPPIGREWPGRNLPQDPRFPRPGELPDGPPRGLAPTPGGPFDLPEWNEQNLRPLEEGENIPGPPQLRGRY